LRTAESKDSGTDNFRADPFGGCEIKQ
jgi:hypothetical protein